MQQPTIVLFLCTGNSARSQMAEAFLRHDGAGRFIAYSAGLSPKGLHPLTVKVMEEIGLDMSGHRSKGVEEFLGKVFVHSLITVCDHADQNCPTTWPGITHREHWSFPDPAAFEGTPEEQLEFFRTVRDQIRAKIRSWIAEQEEASAA